MQRRRSQVGIFWKKVVYSFLFRFKIQEENIYSILGVFFNFEALFRLSQHLWNGGGIFHPQKRRRERPAGISKLSRHAQLMTLCNMSEIPDGDEPKRFPHFADVRLSLDLLGRYGPEPKASASVSTTSTMGSSFLYTLLGLYILILMTAKVGPFCYNRVFLVYNFWEPLHFLEQGYGFQTLELSPKFTLSWAYILLHYFPPRVG